MKKILLLVGLVGVIVGCDSKVDGKVDGKVVEIDRSNCTPDTVLSGVEFRPLRKSELYKSRELTGQKIVNEKATKLLGEVNYKSVDSSTRVVEECTYNGASFVRVIDPEWLVDDKGWIPESALKGKRNPADKYEGLIAEYLLEGYSNDFFVGKNAKFKPFSKDILKYQIEGAKRVIDSGSCDHVEGAIFLADRSDPKNYTYIFDCSNKKRFELSSAELKAGAFKPVSNVDKAPSQSAALERCKALVATKVVNRETLKFHDLLDVSYYKAETTGGVRLVLGFEAKNKFGQGQGYRATCIFSPSGSEEISIAQK
ncbi:hypothetical protein [Pseudomonas putida]|uniref:hypothetical protein n=1 Tax=Pseudomonas putida TaxID=303 RepID=UPI0006764B92|nr:hypothetical protein [Pseudomonas putida]